jgi:hypothetical protein
LEILQNPMQGCSDWTHMVLLEIYIFKAACGPEEALL